MVAGVNSLTTVFSTSSPFIVNSGQTDAAPKSQSTILTSTKNQSSTADIANVFSPAADISKLSSEASSVLLTAQAREKPVILQDPKPKIENNSLGNLDLLDELLSESLNPQREQQAPVQERSPTFAPQSDSASDFASTETRSFKPAEKTESPVPAPRETSVLPSAIKAYVQSASLGNAGQSTLSLSA